MDEAMKIKNTEIAKELSLPPVKLHCSSKLILKSYLIISFIDKILIILCSLDFELLTFRNLCFYFVYYRCGFTLIVELTNGTILLSVLAEDAIKAALQDYKKKQTNEPTPTPEKKAAAN